MEPGDVILAAMTTVGNHIKPDDIPVGADQALFEWITLVASHPDLSDQAKLVGGVIGFTTVSEWWYLCPFELAQLLSRDVTDALDELFRLDLIFESSEYQELPDGSQEQTLLAYMRAPDLWDGAS